MASISRSYVFRVFRHRPISTCYYPLVCVCVCVLCVLTLTIWRSNNSIKQNVIISILLIFYCILIWNCPPEHGCRWMKRGKHAEENKSSEYSAQIRYEYDRMMWKHEKKDENECGCCDEWTINSSPSNKYTPLFSMFDKCIVIICTQYHAHATVNHTHTRSILSVLIVYTQVFCLKKKLYIHSRRWCDVHFGPTL